MKYFLLGLGPTQPTLVWLGVMASVLDGQSCPFRAPLSRGFFPSTPNEHRDADI